ncbi:right-handed parallel beta-helix repeat-containing protein [Paenibacillus allorhizosphaerae]|uniref:Pectate lyase superfamily protein domain-containing protein n=1 Tax=Paenibacillus allorhizosphaerae TaxID=2849866 RepID=A0ABM8VHP8_9BACL|nr:right-handed parallel beta-helix repeat-containing protein [Paenibacillus allorhizosphaerae]CAG7642659.1 hypothetical protein PAECIP111802_02886 [Paenibacillus allorhizosphaerae]
MRFHMLLTASFLFIASGCQTAAPANPLPAPVQGAQQAGQSAEAPGLAAAKKEEPSKPAMPMSSVKAGLVNPDGTEHKLPDPNPVKGKTLNVVDFGADPADDGKDDRPAVARALQAARPGDEVYFPKGVYALKSVDSVNRAAHLIMKNGVNLRGQSRDEVVLDSDFDNRAQPGGASLLTHSNSAVIDMTGRSGIVISDLTISSSWEGTFPTDHKKNSELRGGPKAGIYIDKSGSGPAPSNIWIKRVAVEKFERTGVRISKAHDVVVDDCIFRKATDMGGGGAGYGVTFIGTPKFGAKGPAEDASYNVVQNSKFDGSVSLRHGALLGYAAHHNTVRNNTFDRTRLDSIDLHGDGESYNEIYGNHVYGTQKGAGIGAGNTGGTPPNNHSAAGPYNHIHHNVIRNSMDGIVVIMGTPNTLIEHNEIESVSGQPDAAPMRSGITMKHAIGTIVRDNVIRNETIEKSVGIWLAHDNGDPSNNGLGAGDPQDTKVTGNTLVGHAEAIKQDAGTGTVIENNTVSNRP